MSRFHGNSKYANAPKYFHFQAFLFLGLILYLCIKLDIKQNTAASGPGLYKAINSIKMYSNLPEIQVWNLVRTDCIRLPTKCVCVCVCVCVCMCVCMYVRMYVCSSCVGCYLLCFFYRSPLHRQLSRAVEADAHFNVMRLPYSVHR